MCLIDAAGAWACQGTASNTSPSMQKGAAEGKTQSRSLLRGRGLSGLRSWCLTGYSDSTPYCSELILTMGLDRHVRGCVSHASQAEALTHLVVVQEGLVGLVDLAFD